MQIFEVIIFFKLSTIRQKTVKPTYLCPFGARKLAEGKGHEFASGGFTYEAGRQYMSSLHVQFTCPYRSRLAWPINKVIRVFFFFKKKKKKKKEKKREESNKCKE